MYQFHLTLACSLARPSILVLCYFIPGILFLPELYLFVCVCSYTYAVYVNEAWGSARWTLWKHTKELVLRKQHPHILPIVPVSDPVPMGCLGSLRFTQTHNRTCTNAHFSEASLRVSEKPKSFSATVLRDFPLPPSATRKRTLFPNKVLPACFN